MGWLAERGFDRSLLKTLAAMIAGNLVIYAFGLAWLSISIGFSSAFSYGLYPFIIGDVLKAVLAALLLPGIWRLLGYS